MILKEIKYSSFSYKFKNFFQTSAGTIKERKGFFISICDELGNVTVGECSPLPGFSRETFSDVEKFFEVSSNRLIGNEIENDPGKIKQTASEASEFPSIRFAIEQAMLGLAALCDINFLHNNFHVGKKFISVNAVIGFNKPENILAKVNDKYKTGYRTFKIKVGRENFSDDYEIVKLIRQKFSGGVAIRLDANGKWDVDNALENLAKLSKFDIEYIEEPCGNLSCLMKLAEHSPIPIAVDESLKSYENAKEVLKSGNVKFLVIKPMILGGIIDAARLIKLAEDADKRIIISSSFETPVGKNALVFLSSLTSHNHAHGLDTADMFEKFPIVDPFQAQNANIAFDPNSYPPHFDAGQLE